MLLRLILFSCSLSSSETTNIIIMTPCILPSLVLSLSIVLSSAITFVSATTTTTHARERRSQVFGRILAPDDAAPPVMAAGPGGVAVVGADAIVIAEPHVEVSCCRLCMVCHVVSNSISYWWCVSMCRLRIYISHGLLTTYLMLSVVSHLASSPSWIQMHQRTHREPSNSSSACKKISPKLPTMIRYAKRH